MEPYVLSMAITYTGCLSVSPNITSQFLQFHGTTHLSQSLTNSADPSPQNDLTFQELSVTFNLYLLGWYSYFSTCLMKNVLFEKKKIKL